MDGNELVRRFVAQFEIRLSIGESSTSVLVSRLSQILLLKKLTESISFPWLAFKGLTLQTLSYPDDCSRHSGDVDILIKPTRLKQTLLETREEFTFRTTPRPTSMNQLLAIHRELGTHLDLHWCIALPHLPAPTFDELWAERQAVNVGGLELNTFGPNLGALHLLIHAHQHLFEPRTLLDLALWLEKFQNRPEFGAAADKYGWTRVARLAEELIELVSNGSPLNSGSVEAVLAELILWEWTNGRRFQDLSTRSFIFQVLAVLLIDDKPLLRSLRYLTIGPHRVGTTIDRLRVALGRDPWEV